MKSAVYRSGFVLWFVTSMLVALTGCTTTETVTKTSPESSQATSAKASPVTPAPMTPRQRWDRHKVKLLDIERWKMAGKFSVKTSRKGGAATVRWERDVANHAVEIYGPFGGGRVRIMEDPFSATLTDSKGKVFHGNTAYDVLYEQVGWPVPFDALKYWILGLPIPDVWAQWRLNDTGQLIWLSQAGWEVSFDQYRDRNGLLMPRKLSLKALPGTVNLTFPDGEISDVLEVRFIVKKVSYALADPARYQTSPGG